MGENNTETVSVKRGKSGRKEHKFEYINFSNKDIQAKLLDVDEVADEKTWTSTVVGTALVGACISEHPPPAKTSAKGGNRTSAAGHGEEFGGWGDTDVQLKVTKPTEKVVRNPTRIRDYRDSYRDWKTKEIQFVFHHYEEYKKYVIQYRNDHTYSHVPKESRGSRPGSGSPIVIPPMMPNSEDRKLSIPDQAILNRQQQMPPRLKMDYMTSTFTTSAAAPNNSGSTTPRPLLTTENKSQSESSILELQHKYKFDPDVLKAANAYASNEAEHDSSAECETQSLRSRGGSAKSIRSNRDSAKRRTSGAHLLPLKHGVPLRVGHAGPNTPAPTQVINTTPSASQGPHLTPSSANATTVFQGKTVKHTPSNGYAIEGQTLSRMNTRSPPTLALPSTSLRTLDLLSHVNTIDKQMWFDASGRAYVSLATRYDPIRK